MLGIFINGKPHLYKFSPLYFKFLPIFLDEQEMGIFNLPSLDGIGYMELSSFNCPRFCALDAENPEGVVGWVLDPHNYTIGEYNLHVLDRALEQWFQDKVREVDEWLGESPHWEFNGCLFETPVEMLEAWAENEGLDIMEMVEV